MGQDYSTEALAVQLAKDASERSPYKIIGTGGLEFTYPSYDFTCFLTKEVGVPLSSIDLGSEENEILFAAGQEIFWYCRKC